MLCQNKLSLITIAFQFETYIKQNWKLLWNISFCKIWKERKKERKRKKKERKKKEKRKKKERKKKEIKKERKKERKEKKRKKKERAISASWQ